MHVSGEGESSPPHEIFLGISYSYTTLSRNILKNVIMCLIKEI